MINQLRILDEKMTNPSCGCEKELSELSSCPACSLQLAVVQLRVVGLYILGKLCIYVCKKCCRDPRVKKKAEKNAVRNAESREADDRWQADQVWEACKSRIEERLKRERSDRQHQRTRASLAQQAKILKKNRAVSKAQRQGDMQSSLL